MKTGGVRSEATIQSDVRMLLLDPDLGLADHDLDVQLETQVGQRRRIDVEVGCTVIEVKKSLTSAAALKAATTQLTGYVQTRAVERGQRYVGILTDGRLWVAFHEVAGDLQEATRHVAGAGAAGASPLLAWLEGVLATKRAVRPTPQEIADRLGADSSSHALDHSTLAALYAANRNLPTIALKRDLWANLLRGALGTQFTNTDELFLEHTLLVNSAEIIAHLVLGEKAEELAPATLLSGDRFTSAGLYGVVDRDFFDWVLEVPGGGGFVTALARRLARFDWSAVEHDVLKVLYESVISAETRKTLGEYYTPDWLASQVVTEVVTDPLHQRVLDPSCGSGTFIFYAVRRFVAAAEAAGMSLRDAMGQVSSQVMGIDLHPVAVALARVTYLLALGRDRLNTPGRGNLSVPIYLGDSLGWDLREEDLLSSGYLAIATEVDDQIAAPGLWSHDLRFPDHLLANSATFDDLVQTLVDESARAAGKSTVKLSEGTVRRLALDAADLPVLNANLGRLKELHEAERNHIWSYYIRNVARPAWLGRVENRVDVLLGNPPWLSYRHMTAAMQQRFKTLAQDRDFWHNESTATHQDLAGVFVARAVERYLKTGGRFAFVVPNSVVDRDYWAGFRRGRFDGANVAFTISWDLRRIRPHLFPRASAVIYGVRGAKAARMPAAALIWSGRAPHRHQGVDTARHLQQVLGEVTVSSGNDPRSPYSARFSQGANLVPRLMFRVEEAPATGLGVPYGRASVRSKRSATEKKPWKDLPPLLGAVESEFVWPTLLGEQVLPFRVLDTERFIIPLTQKGIVLDGTNPYIDAYPGLAEWTRRAEALWAEHGRSKLSLTQQIDHMRKLTQQLPPPAVRVVYAASGMHVSAALVTDPRIIVEHGAYWATVTTEAEGRFLVGILNSPVLTDLVRPLMSYGKDERHIDKHVWKLPIPTYDPADDAHLEIARLAGEISADIAARALPSTNFVTNRRDLRTHLAASKLGQDLNALVVQLLDAEPGPPPPAAVVQERTRLLRLTSGTLNLPTGVIELDIDCEFDQTGTVYLWGVLETRPGQAEPVYHSFGGCDPHVTELDVTGQFLDWLRVLCDDAAQQNLQVACFHYGHVETQHLRRIGHLDVDLVLTRSIDVLADVIRPHFYAPTGYSLKRLAPAAGAQWRTSGATGADTLAWITAARTGDADAWQRLLDYNEDDVHALRKLRVALAGTNSPGWRLIDPKVG